MEARREVDELNAAQRAAAEYGLGTRPLGSAVPPLLVLAGAGTGKTKTLAHRVAHLLLHGADPHRVLLLTFTRRAAQVMIQRAQRICGELWAAPPARLSWAGTFHSIANRLLRLHAEAVGLPAGFTILDRADAEDLMNLVREELGLATVPKRFPKKATCLAIYSHAVNTCRPLANVLKVAFPWCEDWAEELRTLFEAYVVAKQSRYVLDYDDLLLYWHAMMEQPSVAAAVRARFDHVLVDEYQDTNALQGAILRALKPNGHGLTVVGDDAQAIFSFRGATVRNLLDFPAHFAPAATVIRLEQNYRSTPPILDACNAVIGSAREGFNKRLFSSRRSQQQPVLISAADEMAQAEFVVEHVLEHREAGIALRRQAILMRAAHHSDQLELELSRRNIPFVKYGGLKFLEAAHVKDVLAVLRWAENPHDTLAAFRVVQLLPGMGPSAARAVIRHLEGAAFELAALPLFAPPAAAREDWPELCRLLHGLRGSAAAWDGQIGRVRLWYEPHLQRLYDAAHVRAGDLEQLEQIAASFPSRERFLTELTLDPPAAAGDEAGPPHLEDDYLILSTIHSAKGREWDVVYVLNVVDGCIPSDMATGNAEQIEEERRLLYVAMTRARDQLYLLQPLRFFVREQQRHGDRHVYAPRSRFISDDVAQHFERRNHRRMQVTDRGGPAPGGRVDVGARLRAMWAD